MNNGGKDKPSFIEKMGARDIPALITSNLPGPENVPPTQSPKLKFIALNDNALNSALYFASVAIWAFQYDAWEKAFFSNGGNSEAAKAAAIATEEMQQIAYQLMEIRSANMDGVAIEGSPLKIEFKTVKEIKDLNTAGVGQPDFTAYPIADTSADDDPYLILTIPKGEKGDPGIDGTNGVDGLPGEKGEKGDPGICPDCTDGTGGTSGGGGGKDPGTIPPDHTDGGSGDGGVPNPDGKDIRVVLSNCVEIPAMSHGPNGNGVEYINVDITGAIKDAAAASGRFDPSKETLVSANISQEAVCYSGRLSSITGFPIDIPLTSDSRHATYTDTKSNSKHGLGFNDTTATGSITVEPPDQTGGSVPPIGTSITAGGRVYENNFNVDLQGNLPVLYDGQFPQLPSWLQWLFTQTLKTGPKTSAYHHMEVCGFVKRKIPVECPDLDPNVTYLKVGDTEAYPAIANTTYWHFGGQSAGDQLIYNNQYGYKGRNSVYGFEEGKTYGCTINGQAYNGGNMSWGIFYSDNSNNGIISSVAINEPKKNNYGLYDFVLNTVTIPTGFGVNKCGVYYIMIFQPEALHSVHIYEVQ